MRSEYFKANISIPDIRIQESLIALLADEGFDDFEQTNDTLIAYTNYSDNLEFLKAICAEFGVS